MITPPCGKSAGYPIASDDRAWSLRTASLRHRARIAVSSRHWRLVMFA
jgi:hypothetical protein